MNSLADRILKRLATTGRTIPELARHVGIKAPSVHDWVNGRTKRLEGMNLIKAAELLECQPEWLATGAGPMAVDAARELPRVELVPIDVVSARANGGPGYHRDDERVIGVAFVSRAWLDRKGFKPEALKQITVEGNSMAPTICEGDEIVVNTDDKVLREGEIYVIATDRGPRVKRLFLPDFGEGVILKSDAPGYPEQRLDAGDVAEIVGRVVKYSRDV